MERLDAFMARANAAYYATHDPFADFTTAPEISQVFGELLGAWAAVAWQAMGSPARVLLVEAGPGRGTLMADALRLASRVAPGFAAAIDLRLVETSPRLASLLAERLPRASLHADLAEVPPGPMILLANEFLDALPIRQFVRDPAGWRERVVGLVDGALGFGLAPPAPQAALAHRLADTRPGDIVEICPAAAPAMAAIAGRIARHGGAAVIVDYGGWHSLGDTLQALSRHGRADPLAAPGLADLTAHVDFEALARAAPGVAVGPLIPQGLWLERLGIKVRAQTLARGLTGAALDAHVAAHRRLTHPDEMGTLFKCLALHPIHTPLPPGFA